MWRSVARDGIRSDQLLSRVWLLWPHESQHARPPCPSPPPGVYPNSCALNQWCHPAISSSVIPFSSHPWSFPASGSFQMSQVFTSGGQRIGISASTSVLLKNIQDWPHLGWTGWSLLFNMLSRLVITFLPKSKHLLISWRQSPSAVILEPKKSLTLFPLFTLTY